jgi:hypothetical protein
VRELGSVKGKRASGGSLVVKASGVGAGVLGAGASSEKSDTEVENRGFEVAASCAAGAIVAGGFPGSAGGSPPASRAFSMSFARTGGSAFFPTDEEGAPGPDKPRPSPTTAGSTMDPTMRARRLGFDPD